MSPGFPHPVAQRTQVPDSTYHGHFGSMFASAAILKGAVAAVRFSIFLFADGCGPERRVNKGFHMVVRCANAQQQSRKGLHAPPGRSIGSLGLILAIHQACCTAIPSRLAKHMCAVASMRAVSAPRNGGQRCGDIHTGPPHGFMRPVRAGAEGAGLPGVPSGSPCGMLG